MNETGSSHSVWNLKWFSSVYWSFSVFVYVVFTVFKWLLQSDFCFYCVFLICCCLFILGFRQLQLFCTLLGKLTYYFDHIEQYRCLKFIESLRPPRLTAFLFLSFSLLIALCLSVTQKWQFELVILPESPYSRGKHDSNSNMDVTMNKKAIRKHRSKISKGTQSLVISEESHNSFSVMVSLKTAS